MNYVLIRYRSRNRNSLRHYNMVVLIYNKKKINKRSCAGICTYHRFNTYETTLPNTRVRPRRTFRCSLMVKVRTMARILNVTWTLRYLSVKDFSIVNTQLNYPKHQESQRGYTASDGKVIFKFNDFPSTEMSLDGAFASINRTDETAIWRLR